MDEDKDRTFAKLNDEIQAKEELQRESHSHRNVSPWPMVRVKGSAHRFNTLRALSMYCHQVY